MSSIKKATISRKKKELSPSKNGFFGTKKIRFNHQASAGETSINLLSLNNGIAGFVQPNAADLLNVYSFKSNLRIYSSLDYELIPEKDYTVLGSTITFINDMASAGAQEGEIFIGEVDVPGTNAIIADAKQRVFDYVLPQGTTTLSLGNSYTIGNKEIAVYRNGKIQVEGVTGNYQEVDDGNGYGTSIEFNTANVSDDDSIVVIFGLAFAGDISIFGDMERLSGAIIAIANDLALATGNPVEDYITANPSEVERDTFGTKVLANESAIAQLEADVGYQVMETVTTTTISSVANTLNKRVLNNVYGDNIGTLQGDGSFNLPSGRYRVKLRGWYYNINHTKVYLRNVTDSSYIKEIAPLHFGASGTGNNICVAEDTLVFTINSNKNFEFQQWTELFGGNGLSGTSANFTGDASPLIDWVCAQVIIKRLGDA
jgi:hypothetical protein